MGLLCVLDCTLQSLHAMSRWKITKDLKTQGRGTEQGESVDVVHNAIISRRSQIGGYMNSKFFLVLAVVLCLGAIAFGQSSAGTIQGSVTDPQGAVVPDASVSITSQSTGRV